MGESITLPPSIVSAAAPQAPRSDLQADASAREVRTRTREVGTETHPSEARQPPAAGGGRPNEDQGNAASRGRLSISLDAETQTMIYRSVDPNSGSVMWQWPAEQTLRMVKFLRELEGLEKTGARANAFDEQA